MNLISYSSQQNIKSNGETDICTCISNTIGNWNGEFAKETTIRPKSRKQPQATNGSLIQRENPATGGVLHLAQNTNVYQFSDNERYLSNTPLQHYGTYELWEASTQMHIKDFGKKDMQYPKLDKIVREPVRNSGLTIIEAL